MAASQLDSALVGAALSPRELVIVRRIVTNLREELGDDLLAVWLYGSRARGEADPAETGPDLRSDIDLMAIVAPVRDAAEVSWTLRPSSKRSSMPKATVPSTTRCASTMPSGCAIAAASAPSSSGRSTATSAF
jgi:hypothetical protein